MENSQTEQVVHWQHRMSADQATRLARLHHAAFATAGCRACEGHCCKDCAAEEGYLRDTELSSQGRQRLKARHGFDPALGFRGPGGCRLPLHERSPTCNVFYCGSRLNTFPDTPTPADDLTPVQRRRAVRAAEHLRRAFVEAEDWL
jgi:hypothetical protein